MSGCEGQVCVYLGASKVNPGTELAPPKKIIDRNRCFMICAADNTSCGIGQGSLVRSVMTGRRSISNERRTNGDQLTAKPQLSGQFKWIKRGLLVHSPSSAHSRQRSFKSLAYSIQLEWHFVHMNEGL